jgi:hypothetical protein
VGQRHLRGGGGADGGGNAGDDLDGDACGAGGLGLFTATPEDEGIAALQPHHIAARQASLTSRALISSWGMEWRLRRLATETSFAPAGAISRMRGSTSRHGR